MRISITRTGKAPRRRSAIPTDPMRLAGSALGVTTASARRRAGLGVSVVMGSPPSNMPRWSWSRVRHVRFVGTRRLVRFMSTIHMRQEPTGACYAGDAIEVSDYLRTIRTFSVRRRSTWKSIVEGIYRQRQRTRLHGSQDPLLL